MFWVEGGSKYVEKPVEKSRSNELSGLRRGAALVPGRSALHQNWNETGVRLDAHPEAEPSLNRRTYT